MKINNIPNFLNNIFCSFLCSTIGALLLFNFPLISQNYHHQDWWYYGANAGMHFTPTGPVVDQNSQMNTWEGCATMSDKKGKLLFYTHAHKIWDATHNEMPTATGYIYGQTGPINSVRQGANIICDPGNPNQYYVFTIGGNTLNLDSFQYFKVDMSLPGNGTAAAPLGNVIAATRRTHIATNRTEAFTATRHANKTDWWIVTCTPSLMEVFHLSAATGLNTTPVYSGSGGTGGTFFDDLGWLRASPDGSKIIYAGISGSNSQLFDFNNATGQVSNRLLLPISIDAEFSPNSRFLYLSHYVGNNSVITQYDLSLAPAAIPGSAVAVGNRNGSFGMGMLLGPDRKIYVAQSGQMGIIHSPNTIGVGCNFDNNPLATLGIFSFWWQTGSQLSIHQTFEPLPDTADFTANTYTICAGENISFTNISSTVFDCHQWIFGDPASGSLDTSYSQNSNHIFNNPGTYTVSLVAELGCHCESDTMRKIITVAPQLNITSLNTICVNEKLPLGANLPGGVWSVISGIGTITLDSLSTPSPGNIVVEYALNGCAVTYTVTATNTQSTFANVNACAGQSVSIHGVNQTTGGIYSQTYTASNGCDSVSNINLNFVPAIVNNIFLNICDGDSIFAGGAWQFLPGTFTDTLSGASSGGCDSIVNTNLVVRPVYTHTNNIDICFGQSAAIHGINQTTSGVYTQSFIAVNGCDSSSSVTLNVAPIATNTVSPSICFGDSVLIAGIWRKLTGIYNETLTGASSAGCDSILTTQLTVHPSPITTASLTICIGQSVSIHGISQNTTGIYLQSFLTANGCDSTSNITLTVLPQMINNTTRTICRGDSILLGGSFQNNSGIFADTLIGASSGGCDSIINTTLIIEELPAINISPSGATILLGDEINLSASGTISYTWDNGQISNPATYTPVKTSTICVTGTSANGCIDTACTSIFVIDLNCEPDNLFIPNVFSPNGDGINDAFCLYGTDCIKTFVLNIYDRWGKLVYSMNDLSDCWDGTYKGAAFNSAVFAYDLDAVLYSKNTLRKSGNISLIR